MKIKKYIDNQLPPEELEKITQELVQAKIRDDYKNRWKKKLEDQYGIQRTTQRKLIERRLFSKGMLWKMVAAVLLFVIVAVPAYYYWPVGLQDRATAMIIDDDFVNKDGGKKGLSTAIEKNREQAARYFNLKQFALARDAYRQLIKESTPLQSDYFFLGYSYLKLGNYPESIDAFYQARALQTSALYLREETNWFLPLALLKAGRLEAAREELLSIKAGEWRYSAAQDLLIRW